jgi:tellurite methyltransferase
MFYMTWKDYVQKTINKKAHKILVKAADLVEPGRALDLGAGALGDSKYLVSKGYQVTAVDSEQSVRDLATGIPNLEVVVTPMEDFIPNHTYELINAQYSLPFVSRENFWKVVSMISDALQEKGVLCATFFGPEDEWKDDSELTFVSKDELVENLATHNLLVIYNEEEKGFGGTTAGASKFWHVFHVIARKESTSRVLQG